MIVTFAQDTSAITGEDPGEPALLRVAAVAKDGKVFVSGGSYHPKFVDEDGFWDAGPRVYAFVAAANLEQNKAVLKAAFAPADADLSNILSDYAIDQVTLDQVVIVTKRLYADTDSSDVDGYTKGELMQAAFWWSINNQKSLTADALEFYTALMGGYRPTETIDDIDIEAIFAFAALNEDAEDPWARELVAFASVKQPVFLSGNATIVGWECLQDSGMLGCYDLDTGILDPTTDLDNSLIIPLDGTELIETDLDASVIEVDPEV